MGGREEQGFSYRVSVQEAATEDGTGEDAGC